MKFPFKFGTFLVSSFIKRLVRMEEKSFQDIVFDFLKLSYKHHELLRDEFGVSKLTVDRWRDGVNSPLYRMRPPILNFIQNHRCNDKCK